MNLAPEYAPTMLVVGLVTLVLFSIHLARCATRYHRFHDARAAYGLLLAIMLVVACAGSITSVLGLLTTTPSWAVVGLSLERGALLVGGIGLLLADMGEHGAHT